jgi:predicted dehydrogenase
MIGLGEIAYKATGEAIQQAYNAEMVFGVDTVEHVAQSYSEAFGIPCSTNLADVLENPDVDAVVISTPHHLHAPLGIQAAEAGKHVMVEKPIATTLEDADALIEACDKAGVKLSCCLVSRYNPDAVKARELIANGAVGDVMALQFFGASNKEPSYWTGGYTQRVKTTWRKEKEKAGGGILIMNFVHDVDRLRYITGLEANRVFAEYDNYRTDGVEVEDFITVTMRYENGALGSLFASSCAPGASPIGIRGASAAGNRIFGTKGQIVFEHGLSVYTQGKLDGCVTNEWTEMNFDRINTRQRYIEDFAEAVLEEKPVAISGEEARKTLEVLLAAYQSGEIEEPVDLPL